MGRVSRIAPVFDPQTRTAEMEIEVSNASYRLKPGMYARVQLTVAEHDNALTVPRNALVDLNGKAGVFVAGKEAASGGRGTDAQPASGPPAMTARFVPVVTGIRDEDRIEISAGLEEGARVITTGATALKDGDRIVAAGANNGGRSTAPAPGRGREGATR